MPRVPPKELEVEKEDKGGRPRKAPYEHYPNNTPIKSRQSRFWAQQYRDGEPCGKIPSRLADEPWTDEELAYVTDYVARGNDPYDLAKLFGWSKNTFHQIRYTKAPGCTDEDGRNKLDAAITVGLIIAGSSVGALVNQVAHETEHTHWWKAAEYVLKRAGMAEEKVNQLVVNIQNNYDNKTDRELHDLIIEGDQDEL